VAPRLAEKIDRNVNRYEFSRGPPVLKRWKTLQVSWRHLYSVAASAYLVWIPRRERPSSVFFIHNPVDNGV
jgi:hypothetical protein